MLTRWLVSIGVNRWLFASSERGSATVETLLWTPILLSLLSLVADASVIFNGQARMQRIVQDANRSLSVGRLSSAKDCEDQIKAKLASITNKPEVHTTITAGLITTTASVPASKLEIVGWFNVLGKAQVTVISQQFVEY